MSPYSGPRFFINQTAHLELTLPIPFFIVSFWEIQWLVHSRLVCVPACRLWGRLVAYWTSCLPRWDRSLPSSVSDQEPSSEAPPSNPLASFRCQLGCYTFTVGKVPPRPPKRALVLFESGQKHAPVLGLGRPTTLDWKSAPDWSLTSELKAQRTSHCL